MPLYDFGMFPWPGCDDMPAQSLVAYVTLYPWFAASWTNWVDSTGLATSNTKFTPALRICCTSTGICELAVPRSADRWACRPTFPPNSLIRASRTLLVMAPGSKPSSLRMPTVAPLSMPAPWSSAAKFDIIRSPGWKAVNNRPPESAYRSGPVAVEPRAITAR